MFVGVITVAIIATTLADDSLRQALDAVQRRQRDISQPHSVFYSQPYIYDGQPEDIGYGYQKSLSPNSVRMFEPVALPYPELGVHEEQDDNKALEKLLMHYLEEGGLRERFPSQFKRSSVFRERDPEGIQRLFEEDDAPVMPSPFRERDKTRIQNAHSLVRNYGGLNVDDRYSNDDNNDYLSVLNQVWEKYKGEEDPEEISEADVSEILEYLANKEDRKRQYGGSYDNGYDFFNSPFGWNKRSKFSNHHKRYPDTLFDERYPYKGQKRFTKRSPSTYSEPLERKKKSDKKTDPKVSAELNNIFDDSNNKSETNTTQQPHTTPGQKEQTIEASVAKPVEIKKKSINWSDYFGYDRKKKSMDWMVDQYSKPYMNPYSKKKRPDDMDSKMRAMEDLIVDEAIKYTGAHEGMRDSKEIQEVKDKVMAQLAAAYSLEKMRRALNEFKTSIAMQKTNAPPSHAVPMPKLSPNHHSQPTGKYEKKEKAESTQGKLEKKESHDISNELKPRIHPSISSISTKVVEEVDNCPVLQELEMRCRQICFMAGDRQEVFLPLCNIHQMCYLCGPELRASSPRECDEAFANEAEEMCDDDSACLEQSKRVLYIAKRARGGTVCSWRSNPCLAQFLAVATLQR
ncbi:uncharacterized protein LOC106670383 [Cimex lectularius]|uniref:Uncharacterized protein n=1 Tax=Cimex lectularius TaxID=79782 RepID=A0A8I6S306_CIMLE|nr:uncharacterized protein LOC106670383 [Cimex lectularius]